MLNTFINVPYVKHYNEKGELTNPITKHKPYISRGTYYVTNEKGEKEPRAFPNHSEKREILRGKRKSPFMSNVTQTPSIKRIKRHIESVSRSLNRSL